MGLFFLSLFFFMTAVWIGTSMHSLEIRGRTSQAELIFLLQIMWKNSLGVITAIDVMINQY